MNIITIGEKRALNSDPTKRACAELRINEAIEWTLRQEMSDAQKLVLIDRALEVGRFVPFYAGVFDAISIDATYHAVLRQIEAQDKEIARQFDEAYPVPAVPCEANAEAQNMFD